MAVLENSNLSSDKRPIQLRKRSDLVLQETVYQGEKCWIVKDPVAMKYFRLQTPEKIAFDLVDGQCSYSDIKLALEKELPEEKIRITDIHMLVNSFHKNGLLISNAGGQAAPLQVKRNKELKQKAMQLFMSVLSLRFPGVDPERFLSWLYPKVSWLFSRTCTLICMGICLSALLLVLQNIDEFYRRLPEFQQFFDIKNIFFMATILIVTKSIHELGHGLMCKHFGGECHEIGFMLLVMTPAMYCNTSDSWILPNKWHRIAIGAAGMYVEVVIASVCTWIWWYTQPGVVHYMSLNIMFLCGVSTLIFNANPLLRYDGYYMLSDYLEIPNLGSKSRMSLVSKLRVWCLGMKPINSRLLPQRRQVSFAIYAVASFVYRWFIMLMIFWFLVKVFEPYGLAVLGHFMIVFSVFGMVGIPLYKMVKFFLYPGRFREVKKARFAISAVLVAFVSWFIFMIPIKHDVRATFVVQPLDAQKVFVTEPGNLTKVNFVFGSEVQPGDVIAELENEDLELSLEQTRGALASSKAKLAAYKLQSEDANRVNVSKEIQATKAEIRSLEKRIELQQSRLVSLSLVAERTGKVISPPNVVEAPAKRNDLRQLETWSGTPLDRENRNAFLASQTLVCLIGDPGKMKATLVVDQADAKFVQPGQPVVLMLDEHAGQRLQGEIEFVSREPVAVVPRELSLTNGGEVATQPDGNGQEIPLIPSYEASVRLDTDLTVMTGFRGHAKINVGTLPLGQRFLRYLATVINFR